MDETYVGGRSRKERRGRKLEQETAVVALVERGGCAYSKPVERIDADELKGAILEMVDRNSRIMTDE